MINFTNEELVYLYKHFAGYKDMIHDQIQRQMEMMKSQVEAFKRIYGDTDQFDSELYDLHERLVTEEMPKSINEKLLMINSVIDKFYPFYEMITESDQNIDDRIRKTYLEEPDSIKELLDEIADKINRRDGK